MELKKISKHLMTGVSYMIPITIIGGLLASVAVMIGGPSVWDQQGTFASNILAYGLAGLKFIVPMISAYIAFSIADRAALAPAFVCGIVAGNMGTGFLGGMLVGLMVGYTVNLLKKIKFPIVLTGFKTIMFIPLVTTFIVGMILTYIIGGPIVTITNVISSWLNGMSGANAILLAGILGLMMSFDMGGPLNKIAYTFGIAAFTSQSYTASSAMLFAISIPPLGLALATLLKPRLFNEAEIESGRSAILMGIIGITEGAIPFAVGDPLRVIPSIMIGTALGSMTSIALGVENTTVFSTIMAIPFVNKPFSQIIAIIVGVSVTAGLVIMLKSFKFKKGE